ncbi:nitroreductase family protein [Streptomyces sp. BK208]|nr:nitroreductase family protein [Streptomyces sp. BK208]
MHAALSTALPASSGSDDQLWQWVVVTDAEQRNRLAECYRRASRPYLEAMGGQAAGDPERCRSWRASVDLAEHLHRVPVLVVPCLSMSPDAFEDRFGKPGFATPVDGVAHSVHHGALWPALWGLVLALRLRGLACAVTTLHLARAREAAGILRLPDHVTQAGLLAVARPEGTHVCPAPRRSVEAVQHQEFWRPAPSPARNA